MESSLQTILPNSNRTVEFQFNGQSHQTSRVIGDWGDAGKGPTLVFFGAIHGNEPTGVVALKQVFAELENAGAELHGRVLGLAGNLQALAENRRFINYDLNRIWTKARLQQHLPDDESSETREQNELNRFIGNVLESKGEKYFFDLHTTSSASAPFVAINDQLANRDFAANFPVSTIFGIEEYLEGPLLSYLNDFGHVAFAFEAGQHTDPKSVETHKSFIRLALLHAGLLGPKRSADKAWFDPTEESQQLGSGGDGYHRFFEVVHREAILAVDEFKMEHGFENFDAISKGQLLAKNIRGEIHSRFHGNIFMPLYQNEGTDGFFVIRGIPRWALWLSRFLRGVNFDRILAWLPGVSRPEGHPETLVVNKKVAFLLRNQLFHLLGYRRKQDRGSHVTFSRREISMPTSDPS